METNDGNGVRGKKKLEVETLSEWKESMTPNL